MGYTTVDLSPEVAGQLDLSKLTPEQVAEIAEAGRVLAQHSIFDTAVGVQCRSCMQDNRCTAFHTAMATYDRFHIVPKRQRRARHPTREIRPARGEDRWMTE